LVIFGAVGDICSFEKASLCVIYAVPGSACNHVTTIKPAPVALFAILESSKNIQQSGVSVEKMIKILGLISVLAASTYSSSTVGSTRRSVPPTHELAALKVTPNYLPLTRRHNVPTISDTSAPSVINLKGPGHGRLLFGTSILVFNVKVTIAGQDFELLLDGTSSDTWVVTEGFTCLNGTDQEISEASCDFGPTLQGDYATRTVKNVSTCAVCQIWVSGIDPAQRNFNLTYPNEASFYGDFAKLDITLAGIHVKNQMVGLVDLVQIPGPVLDNITSGILGMAYSSVTSAFIGNNGTLDNRTIGTAPGDRSPYSAIFETMATEGLTPALWSLALERPKPNYGLSSPGGYIAFGGLPPVAFDPIFSSTPIEIVSAPCTRA